MELDDVDLRSMLDRRATRAAPGQLQRIVVPIRSSGVRSRWSPVFARTLTGARSTMAILLGAVAIAVVVGLRLGNGNPAGANPHGLFQSDTPVGTGQVGARTCVALNLDDSAYSSGSVTVSWWLVDGRDCRISTSGISTSPATLTPVPVPTGALPARAGYRIDLKLDLVASGSETITFVLDPTVATATPGAIAAHAGSSASGPKFEFSAVGALDVREPGAKPIPTPHSQRPS